MTGRFVIDTNVVVSALLVAESIPRQAFDKALDTGTILLSLPVLTELNEVFSRRKFDRYLLEAERMQFLAALVREAEMVEITEQIISSRDPKDNKFLELAVSGRASHLISGDDDLLVLHPFRDIAILRPQVFLHL